MFDRKEAKRFARHNLKRHYGIFVLACLLVAFLGVDFIGTMDSVFSVSSVQTATSAAHVQTQGEEGSTSERISDFIDTVILSTLTGNTSAEESNRQLEALKQKSTKIFGLEIGHSRGVFASVVNAFASGSLIVKVITTVRTMFGANSVWRVITLILFLIFGLVVWALIINTSRAGMRRLLLEGRLYGKVPYRRFLYIYERQNILPAAVTLVVVDLFQLLWDLTIIGGIIKYFSYFCVPYIVAENPQIPPLRAIKLSRRMMRGHKWKCFKLLLTFIGWDLLGLITFGIVSVMYSNPYREATCCEFYTYVRGLAKENEIPDADLLGDIYLYEKPDRALVEEVYGDIVELRNTPAPPVKERRGFGKFMADVFGIVWRYDEAEKSFRENADREAKIAMFETTLQGETYPLRLMPRPKKERRHPHEFLHYMRHYSVGSLILLFFGICIFGWIWEVCLHMMVEGGFVNRGMLHGPWIPIYGAGSLLILVMLNKLRKRPVVLFLAAIVLCGVLEYGTSVVVEAMHGGEMWWDYSGYFLNLYGRICAEGLLVFGIGGSAIVYFVAPLHDNLYARIPRKAVIIICSVLIALFSADAVYSAIYPNRGEGISNTEIANRPNKPGGDETAPSPTGTTVLPDGTAVTTAKTE